MSQPIATTTHGRVAGEQADGLAIFRGIPFAAPPVGPRRWQPPAPADPWDGVRDATRFGSACPQNPMPIEGPLAVLSVDEPQDEDCLTLNVWTPGVDAASRPVMVWIHGGAFTTGSGSLPLYDGARLARRGVVVVTINYRLNALGFLHIDELFDGYEGSGNCGILDQVAALEWIQANIAAFGGDPANITIFGESAGGMSVGTLLGTPKAAGLFRRAIPQSGAGHHNLSAAAATRMARHFLDTVGVAPGDRDALEALTTAKLLEGVMAMSFLPPAVSAELLGADRLKKMAFQPVVDGVVRDRLPIDAVAAGVSGGVDVMLGSNTEEWRLFLYGLPEEMRGMVPPSDLDSYFGDTGRSADDVIKVYEMENPGAGPRDLDCAIDTDLWFTMPAIRLADAQAAHNPNTYRYLFSWRTPVVDGLLGACHALEIPFVFGNLDLSAFVGDAPPADLSDAMQQAWVAFATSGDPGWPAWDSTSRQVMDFGDTRRVVADPEAARRALWDGVV